MLDHIPWILFVQIVVLMLVAYAFTGAIIKSFCESWHKFKFVAKGAVEEAQKERDKEAALKEAMTKK